MTQLDQAGFERAIGRPLLSRRGFADALGAAVADGRGFAAGKLGGSEQAWLMHPLLLEREDGGRRLRAFEAALAFRSLRHAGVWPAEPSFLRRFSAAFSAAVGELDAIGLFADAFATELEILSYHRPAGAPMRFEDQEPDRSAGGDPADCWLEHLRGRRVVIVCPFADLLRERARADVYEAVWASSGKRWFGPAAVESVEIPYGFDPDTQARYGDALELLDEVDSRLASLDFDCALIGAGGLGIPLAARVKGRGAVAVSLGGHLQVVFGVHGERWRSKPEWRERWINDSWVSIPERYRPDPALTGEDYW